MPLDPSKINHKLGSQKFRNREVVFVQMKLRWLQQISNSLLSLFFKTKLIISFVYLSKEIRAFTKNLLACSTKL